MIYQSIHDIEKLIITPIKKHKPPSGEIYYSRDIRVNGGEFNKIKILQLTLYGNSKKSLELTKEAL